ncbi:nitroreductase family deazaflavin-dependent oxidoreductase [Actinoplanes sp. NPDC049802]|uniref:nitroreductase family deazaflavin-dependent oxidoreductase n=1 Tax=Actinoplanes sp. NPDC049802 TaxID=3154742 RepID=UPI003410648E
MVGVVTPTMGVAFSAHTSLATPFTVTRTESTALDGEQAFTVYCSQARAVLSNREATMRYLAPKRASNLFNDLAKWLTARGISLLGSRVLAVRGRKSGEIRTTVVNLFTHEGERYLLAPRGHTQWVRNLRAAGEGELRLGRRSEPFTAVEVADADKPPLIRLYLRKWAWETGAFFDGLKAGSPEADLVAAAPGFPVFRIVTR